VENSTHVKYCKGYKFQLREPFYFKTPIKPGQDIGTDLVRLKSDGWLIIDRYFAWDGASGLAVNTKTNIRAVLVHDAIYYLMRMGLLPTSHRQLADKLLSEMMIVDGACKARASMYEAIVKKFGGRYSDPANARTIYTAP
jgi:hypothetical protein